MKTVYFGFIFLLFPLLTWAQFTDPDKIAKGSFYALIVGVANYDDPNVRDLDNPVRDAQRLRKVLTEKYNFEPSKVHFLENPNQDLMYEKLEFFKNNLRENDVWLVFFAGHGFWDKTFGTEGEGYWMLRDSYKNRRNSWLSNTDLKNYIASMPNQHTLIIADACFSGGLAREENFMDNAPKDIKTVYQDKSRIAMTSGSLEAVPDNSVFFKYLIENLEKNEAPYLRALNLFVKIDPLVRVNAGNKPIFAPIQKVGHEFGDFVFIRKKDTQKIEEEKRQEALRREQEAIQAEESAWTKAKNLNTILAYQTYVSSYPNSKYKNIAESAINQIQQKELFQADETAWVKAKNTNTIATYNAYLQQYPQGKYTFEAQMAKKALEKQQPTINNQTKDLLPFEPEMVYVEGGTFQMGCTSEQQECGGDEEPVHSVTLSSFSMGKYEVTQKQWRDIMGSNPSYFKDCDNCPVEQVSWEDVQEYIKKLNAKTGKTYRLPTEAEWEFAARGGKNTKKTQYSGGNTATDIGWLSENSGNKTHPVGTKKANELGIYDMSGNVWEWCSDWYGAYSASAQTNPTGANTGSGRVVRGGSKNDDASSLRVAARSNSVPTRGIRLVHIGFRLARID